MKLRILCFVALVTLLSSFPLAAQTSFGTILGNVADESGAVVPGVAVTITNEGTGNVRTVTSNDTGGFTVPSLPPSVYSVSAELAGFSQALQTGVQLAVNQTLRVDLTLKVGEVTEIVEVSAAALQLQTDTSTVASTVDNKKVVELPLNGRSFTQLTILMPGAVAGAGALTAFQTSGTAVSISGLRAEANNYTLDGVNNNESFFKTYGLPRIFNLMYELQTIQRPSASLLIGARAR